MAHHSHTETSDSRYHILVYNTLISPAPMQGRVENKLVATSPRSQEKDVTIAKIQPGNTPPTIYADARSVEGKNPVCKISHSSDHHVTKPRYARPETNSFHSFQHRPCESLLIRVSRKIFLEEVFALFIDTNPTIETRACAPPWSH